MKVYGEEQEYKGEVEHIFNEFLERTKQCLGGICPLPQGQTLDYFICNIKIKATTANGDFVWPLRVCTV